MKNITLTILTFLLSSAILFGQKNDLAGFETFLGSEKVEAINMLEKSFDSFLVANFPSQKTMDDKTKKFLQIIKETGEIEENWKFNSSLNSRIIKKIESSGLRKEFWTYGYENYIPFYYHQFLIDSIKSINPDTNLHIDSNALMKQYTVDEEIIPIINSTDSVEGMTHKEWSDSLLEFNWRGQYLFAIERYSFNDKVIDEYIDAKIAGGNISPSLMASGLMYHDSDLTEPLVKRIILMEIYYGMIKWNLKDKKTTR